jgi:hypothetical protein
MRLLQHRPVTKQKHQDPDAAIPVPSTYGPEYVIERYGHLIHLTRTLASQPKHKARIVMSKRDVIKVCNALIDATETNAA